MAISKNSIRKQFTLNSDKQFEKVIVDYLATCIDEKSKIKEILYNYIMSNGGTKLPQVTQIEVTQSYPELPKVSNNNTINKIKVSNGEGQLQEVSELEINEMEELYKFL